MTVRDPLLLTCKEVVELITEFLSGAMRPEDRARLEQHLFVCPPCSSYLGQIRSTIGMASGLRAAEAEAGPAAGLLELFRIWSKK